jgi:hypothetical protein
VHPFGGGSGFVEVRGCVTSSSDFPSALIPKRISTIPPIIMIPAAD